MQNDQDTMADSDKPTGVSLHSGFPNPAADNFDQRSALALNLNQLLVRHPSSTYLFRIRGEAWAEQGIFDNDIAIIDRAVNARAYDLVLTWHDDQFELCRKQELPRHTSAWGTVSAIIHPYH